MSDESVGGPVDRHVGRQRPTITITGAHGISAGDVVEVTRIDRRWWRRLWFWLLRRGSPTITTRLPLFLWSALAGVFIYGMMILYDTAKGVLIIIDYDPPR